MKNIKKEIELRRHNLFENSKEYFCRVDCHKDFCGCSRKWGSLVQQTEDDLFKYKKLHEFKIKFGKYKGHSYAEIAKKDPAYVRWLFDSYSLPKKTLLYKILEFVQPYLFTITDYIEDNNIKINDWHNVKCNDSIVKIEISEVVSDFKVYIIISYAVDTTTSGYFVLKDNKLFCHDLKIEIDLINKTLFLK